LESGKLEISRFGEFATQRV